jgi:PAS domain S-box-containing protein
LLGLERGELIGRKISDFIAKEDQDIYYIYRKKLFNLSEPASCDLQVVNSKNKKLWIQMSATCNNNFNDKPIIRLTMNDISEHKRMQNELKSKDDMIIVQSRQAAVGEMISMIAHQWRQPLNIIGLAVTNVETKQMLDMLDDFALEDNIKIITKNVSYMSETIDTFRNFFKPDTVKELKTMNDVLKSISSIVGSSLENNNIKLNIINNSQTALLIHKSSLVQVLLNLINNAKDAFSGGHADKAVINVTIEETTETVIIKICDNAGGIPEDIIYDITKPYFTTKDLNGTGLGLYICQTIIEKHFAGIFGWYNENYGACFVITLNKE